MAISYRAWPETERSAPLCQTRNLSPHRSCDRRPRGRRTRSVWNRPCSGRTSGGIPSAQSHLGSSGGPRPHRNATAHPSLRRNRGNPSPKATPCSNGTPHRAERPRQATESRGLRLTAGSETARPIPMKTPQRHGEGGNGLSRVAFVPEMRPAGVHRKILPAG